LAGPVKSSVLLRHNIDALLKKRGQSRRDLAQWCRRSESWLSQIFTKPERDLPLKYLDRIADFFGIDTFQLFQPGISPLLERRKRDRRSGRDRRLAIMQSHIREQVSSVVASLTPDDVADVIRLRALSPESRDVLRQSIQALRRSEPKTYRPKRPRRPADPPSESSTGDVEHGERPPQRGAGGGE
jgi:lambda repressor-like predicted transcriptional regulator